MLSSRPLLIARLNGMEPWESHEAAKVCLSRREQTTTWPASSDGAIVDSDICVVLVGSRPAVQRQPPSRERQGSTPMRQNGYRPGKLALNPEAIEPRNGREGEVDGGLPKGAG